MSKKKSTLSPALFPDGDKTISSIFGDESASSFLAGCKEFVSTFEQAIEYHSKDKGSFTHLTALESAVIALRKECSPGTDGPPEHHAWQQAAAVVNRISEIAHDSPDQIPYLTILEDLIALTRNLWLATGAAAGYGAFRHELGRQTKQRSEAGKTGSETKKQEEERLINLYKKLRDADPSIDDSSDKRIDAVLARGNFSFSRRKIRDTLASETPLAPGRKKKGIT